MARTCTSVWRATSLRHWCILDVRVDWSMKRHTTQNKVPTSSTTTRCGMMEDLAGREPIPFFHWGCVDVLHIASAAVERMAFCGTAYSFDLLLGRFITMYCTWGHKTSFQMISLRIRTLLPSSSADVSFTQRVFNSINICLIGHAILNLLVTTKLNIQVILRAKRWRFSFTWTLEIASCAYSTLRILHFIDSLNFI